jgi:hypothetical protein
MLSATTNVMPTSNTKTCAWCDCTEDIPIDKHRDWCERKIAATIVDKGNSKKVKKITLEALENKVKDLMCQISEYETVLSLIATPVRPDGTDNRDRNACRILADNVLRSYRNKKQ